MTRTATRNPSTVGGVPTSPAAPPATVIQRGEETITQLGNARLDAEPERPGVTPAVAGLITPTEDRGLSRGAALEQAREEEGAAPVKKIRRFVALADKQISSGGARVLIREGKELDEVQYNIKDLKNQGVRLREITDEVGEE